MTIRLSEERRKDLIDELVQLGGEDLLKCYQCGTCIADCPTGIAEEPLSPKKLIYLCKLGLADKLLEDESPWMCVTCAACEERCPRGAEPFEIVLAIRRWQCKEDETYIPLVLGEIYERGHTQNVLNPMREELQLPPIRTVAANEEMLKKFRELLRETEVVKQHGYMFGIEG